jgi:hypothetical protein
MKNNIYIERLLTKFEIIEFQRTHFYGCFYFCLVSILTHLSFLSFKGHRDKAFLNFVLIFCQIWMDTFLILL